MPLSFRLNVCEKASRVTKLGQNRIQCTGVNPGFFTVSNSDADMVAAEQVDAHNAVHNAGGRRVIISTDVSSINSPSAEECLDVFDDLRYLESIPISKTPKRRKTSPVTVKKHWPFLASITQPRPATLLNCTLDSEGPLQVFSDASSIVQKSVDALQRHSSATAQDVYIGRVTNIQAKSLKRWVKQTEFRRETERKLCRTLKRPAQNLIFNKSAVPPIVHSQKERVFRGEEYDFPQKTQHERFFPGTAYWHVTERTAHAGNDIPLCMTWTERHLYKPPCSIVRQDPDAEYMKLVDKAAETEGKPQGLQNMFVRGHSVLDKESCPNTGDAGDDGSQHISVQPSDDRPSQRLPVGDDVGVPQILRHPPCPHEPHPATLCQSQSHSIVCPCFSPLSSSKTSARSSRNAPERYDKPCLRVNEHVFLWQAPRCVEMIELALQSIVGLKVTNSLMLCNLGPTVIRYAFYKDTHFDHFGTGRYKQSPITFTFNDGFLLPNENTSLVVHFLASHSGKWHEYWHLTTKPRLGPEDRGDIIISVWGMAINTDVHVLARERLNRDLDRSAMQRMVSRIVDDLVRFLPFRNSLAHMEQEARKWPKTLSRDDVLLFRQNNPCLVYRSQQVYNLLDLQKYVKVLMQLPPPAEEKLKTFKIGGQRNVKGTGTHVPFRVESDAGLGHANHRQTVLMESKQKLSVGNLAKLRPRKSQQINVKDSTSRLQTGRRASKQSKDDQTSVLLYSANPSFCSDSSRVQLGDDEKIDDDGNGMYYDEVFYGNCNLPLPSIEHLGMQRAGLDLTRLPRDIMALNEPLWRCREPLFYRMNTAVASMTEPENLPIWLSFKYMLCKQTLAQAFDDIALGEWRLRRNLKLKGRVTFSGYLETPKSDTIPTDKSSSGVVAAMKSQSDFWQIIEKKEEFSSDPECTHQITEAEVMSDESSSTSSSVEAVLDYAFIRDYQSKLYTIVYDRVGKLVESLQFLMDFDKEQDAFLDLWPQPKSED